MAGESVSAGSRETRGAGSRVSSGFQPIVQLNRRSSAWVSAPAPCRKISASVQAATASSNAASASRATARSRHAIASPFFPPMPGKGLGCTRRMNREPLRRRDLRTHRLSLAGLPGRRGAAARPRPGAAPGRAARGSDRSSGPPAAIPWPIPGSIMPAVAAADSGSTRSARCHDAHAASGRWLLRWSHPSWTSEVHVSSSRVSMSRSAAFARFLVLVKIGQSGPDTPQVCHHTPCTRSCRNRYISYRQREPPGQSPSSRQRGNSSVVSACA